ncbi:MAG: hypothetical protein RMJ39_10310 [Deltaproteobacteria bacterium]|nr:hypothetical protein [Deltaproteobacteria bacterium]
MIVCQDWIEYVRQILNHACHGYEYYCPVVIPEKKRDRIPAIDRKLLGKYPMCEWNKDQRYRAKKQGRSNYVYIRWDLSGILMHTPGIEPVGVSDRFFVLSEKPYQFRVGSWIEIKIGPARTGKRFTAYLTKQSFRSIKALLIENIEKGRFEEFEKYYYRLENLPAFSGILTQISELYRSLKAAIRKAGLTNRGRTLRRLKLRSWKGQ